MTIDDDIETAKRLLREQADERRQRWLTRLPFLGQNLLPALASNRIGLRFDCGDHWMTLHLTYAPDGESLGTVVSDGKLTEYLPPEGRSEPLIRFHDQAEQRLVFSDKEADMVATGPAFAEKVCQALVRMIAATEIEAETA
jgi:hypothetical protein